MTGGRKTTRWVRWGKREGKGEWQGVLTSGVADEHVAVVARQKDDVLHEDFVLGQHDCPRPLTHPPPRVCVCACVSLKVTHASGAKIPRRRGSLQTEVSSCGENVRAHVCTSRTWMHAVDMRCGMVPGSFLAQTFLYPPGETCTMMHAQPLHTCSTPSRGTSGRRREKIVIDSAFW